MFHSVYNKCHPFLYPMWFSSIQRQALCRDDDDDGSGEEKEDEKPTVVVLKEGDLTEEEAERLRNEAGAEDVDQSTHEGQPLITCECLVATEILNVNIYRQFCEHD